MRPFYSKLKRLSISLFLVSCLQISVEEILTDFVRILSIFLLFYPFAIVGQARRTLNDSVGTLERLKNNKITQRFFKQSTHEEANRAFNERSEVKYLPYAGKIIRHIFIKRVDFERTILDTTKIETTFFSRIGNKLHTITKEWVVRNNLFIEEGTPLNPYRLADNERYLRDINFILDSRIFVKPISNCDSVDLIVMTRDVFSLQGNFTPINVNEYQGAIEDANFAGMAQQIRVASYYNANRSPRIGYEWLYKKSNLFGSFIDATFDYTQINTGSRLGTENESAYYFRLSRPFFMPYTRWAGSLELSHNWSVNVYEKPDSLFAHYQYDIRNAWIGYSFGEKRKMTMIEENRHRRFIALRGYQNYFLSLPTVMLSPSTRSIYNDRSGFLAQLTFFKQDFYKTQYILGFGRTEDVPYGYRVAFTSGLEKEFGRQRIYTSIDTYRNIVGRHGNILTLNLQTASYWRNKNAEDLYLSLRLSGYSKIREIGNQYRLRLYTDFGYAAQAFQVSERQIGINNSNGIGLFRSDSLLGRQRLVYNSELVVYTPWKVEGFHIAPVIRMDLAFLAQRKDWVWKGVFSSGYSGGFRVRNENLIFNTIEMKVYYYPNVVQHTSHFLFDIRTNLRIKYPDALISAPRTVYD